MKYRLVVRPEVDADLLQAESWYEQQQPGGEMVGTNQIKPKVQKRVHRQRIVATINNRRYSPLPRSDRFASFLNVPNREGPFVPLQLLNNS